VARELHQPLHAVLTWDSWEIEAILADNAMRHELWEAERRGIPPEQVYRMWELEDRAVALNQAESANGATPHG
jgi:hypothetical protein